ncbi:VacJ family lipoprotein [Catenovulum maritimum]|uniref:ABC transporter n=1 Tax=Catenovulum maritimum TaxID=1513271 RepID=A0A0J8JKX2_9ALTE|nr:VacJ family lipoprotein [Catenovulum maritimum]KMT65181.1 ABC transporter [Catenovulum maritimum]
MHTRIFVSVFLSMLLASCATVTPEQKDDKDPLQAFNRSMWDFNYNVLDKHILKPAAKGYQTIMPQPARTGFLNMANNLEEPSAIVNNLLQAKPGDAAISTGRFVVNSTFGLLGLVDVAKYAGMEAKHEEFGEVLGKWGVGNGPYLMVPGMGPTDVRTSVGDFVDSAYFPLDDLTIWASAFRISVKALEGRISLMAQEQLLEDSFDPYVFVKEAYFQRTLYKVYDGNPPRAKEVTKEEEEDFENFLNDLSQ